MGTNEAVFICLGMMLALPFMASAAVIIEPGQSANCTGNETVSCSLCQFQNYTCQDNQTACPECPSCNITVGPGKCELDKDLEPSEFFQLKSGPCDVEVWCGDCKDKELQKRFFPLEIRVEKLIGDDIHLGMEIRDFLGQVVESKNYAPFEVNDTIVTTYQYDFECPTDVVVEGVNYRTCSGYFKEYFTETSPAFMQLATGTSECVQQLISCEGNLSATASQMRDEKDQKEDCITMRTVANDKVAEMNHTMLTMQADITGEVVGKTSNATNTWMAVSIVEFIAICVIVGSHLTGGTEGT